jgi:hypothetical protein
MLSPIEGWPKKERNKEKIPYSVNIFGDAQAEKLLTLARGLT